MLFAWWPLIGIWLVNERLHPPADGPPGWSGWCSNGEPNVVFRKALEGAAPRRVISIYDMLIPSYEFRDIPRRIRRRRESSLVRKTSTRPAQEGGKVVFDERGSMSPLLPRAAISFFRFESPRTRKSRENRGYRECVYIDGLGVSIKLCEEYRKREFDILQTRNGANVYT